MRGDEKRDEAEKDLSIAKMALDLWDDVKEEVSLCISESKKLKPKVFASMVISALCLGVCASAIFQVYNLKKENADLKREVAGIYRILEQGVEITTETKEIVTQETDGDGDNYYKPSVGE